MSDTQFEAIDFSAAVAGKFAVEFRDKFNAGLRFFETVVQELYKMNPKVAWDLFHVPCRKTKDNPADIFQPGLHLQCPHDSPTTTLKECFRVSLLCEHGHEEKYLRREVLGDVNAEETVFGPRVLFLQVNRAPGTTLTYPESLNLKDMTGYSWITGTYNLKSVIHIHLNDDDDDTHNAARHYTTDFQDPLFKECLHANDWDVSPTNNPEAVVNASNTAYALVYERSQSRP